MSIEQNKEVIRRWLNAFGDGNRQELDRLADELYTADYVLHDPGLPALPPGPAGIKQFVQIVFTDWATINVTLDDIVAEGDRVAFSITGTGVKAATGKTASFQGIFISRFADGKIAEEWGLSGPEQTPS
jgi:ketosteroid isomerase-like protein